MDDCEIQTEKLFATQKVCVSSLRTLLLEPSVLGPDVPQISIISRSLQVPPDHPFENDCYWITKGAEQDWSDQADRIAVCKNKAWHFMEPEKGLLIWIGDEADFRIWDGRRLVSTAMHVNPVTQLKSCLRSGSGALQTAGKLQLKMR